MRDTKLILVFLGILVFLALGVVLHMLKAILLPFVIAVFLGQIFIPAMAALRRLKVPSGVAIVLILVGVSALLFAFSWVIYSSALAFKESLPAYEARLGGLVQGAVARLVAAFPFLREPVEGFHWQEAVEVSSVGGLLAAGVGSFLVFFNELFLVLLYLVFLLAGSESFPHKLERALKDRAERVATVIANIEGQVRRYLLTKTLVNLGHGILVAVLLAAFGVDFAPLWGFLTFIAHYIPTVGAVISVGLPTIFMLLQFESTGWALLVAAINLAVQFFIGNMLEPRIMGTSLDLSPIIVLLSLIFWGWLWGAWGMILAVPITSTLKIVCENVAALQPLSVLMSGSAEKA
ncbi:MAG TPA: AI-2E family transporter [Thermoanaerobaculia bacterium]|jgi:predicted PurR-regulated permease PerM|nr:AI-2E family transporter [Thermoanaerobaculia bacterium]